MAEIVLQKVYHQEIEQVWKALTTAESLAQWLMPNDFKLEMNHRFQFRTKPQKPFFDGIVECEVVEINAPHALAYTWKGGAMKKPTLVRWQLKKVENGTELTLSHSGFEGLGGYLLRFILGSGWKGLLQKTLLKYLETNG
jgi:uncharacterized protein YndB with AHSA1/START domain